MLQIWQAASVSRRQILDADRVIGNALKGVARIQQNACTARSWPIREARTVPAGVATAMIAIFRMNGTAGKGQWW
jgi:hypothetical protein